MLLQPTCINHTLSKCGRLVALSEIFKHVVIHKCVLFLNFEFEKKKKNGWPGSVFWIEHGIFYYKKKKFNPKFLEV